MKKSLLVIVFLCVCFCISADFKTSGNFRPLKIVRTYVDYDGTDEITFSYTKEGALLKIDYGYYYKTYEYNEKKQVSKIGTFYNEVLSANEIITYNAQGKIAASTIYDKEDKLQSETKYFYTEKGLLHLSMYNNMVEESYKNNIILYEYGADGKLLKSLSFWDGVLNSEATVKYNKSSTVISSVYPTYDNSTGAASEVYNAKGILIETSYKSNPVSECSDYTLKINYDKNNEIISCDLFGVDNAKLGKVTLEWEKGKFDQALFSEIMKNLPLVGC